jgi:hypothetical protein
VPLWSSALRGEVTAAAVLLCIALITIALFRNRWAVMGLIGLAIGCSAGIAMWQRSLGSVDRGGGDVIVSTGSIIQRDQWEFYRARQSTGQSIAWAGWTHPFFSSPSAMAGMGMKISIGVDSNPRFDFHLRQGTTIAFVRREVRPGSAPPIISNRISPMRESARQVYMSTGDRILGETAGDDHRWGGVVITRGG